MTRSIRLLLVLLLALAIPLKGLAAAAQACAGDPAGAPATVPAAQHQAHSQHHDGHEHAAAHDHHAPHDQHAAHENSHQSVQSAAPDGSSAMAADSHEPGPGKCSVCAACCSAVAITAAASLRVPDLKLATPVAPVPVQLSSFITGGPRRPPRPIPA